MSLASDKNISFKQNNYKAIHQKYLVKGSLIFVLITLVTFIVLFIVNDSVKLLDVIKQIRIGYVFFLILLLANDAYLDALRYFVLAKKINPSVKFRLIFESNMADSFGGAITPFQAGGGPAMLFMMNRGGIEVARGLSIIITTFFITLSVLLCASLVSVFLFQYHFSNIFLDYLLSYSIVTFSIVLVLIIVSLLLPTILLERIIIYCTKSIEPSKNILSPILFFIIDLLKVVREYILGCRHLLISYPKTIFNTFIVTVLYFLNRFLFAYCLVFALGGIMSFKKIVTTQSLILFLPYFAPTPGGSGFTEVSINGLMSDSINGGILFSFTYLYRFLLYYIYIIIGGFSMTKQLNQKIVGKMENLPL